MAPKTRIKSQAQINVPQTRDDAAKYIRDIGDAQRALLRHTADMNDAIADVTAQYQPEMDKLGELIKTLQEGVQAYCEANRDDLTNGGKVKFANLITGEVQWRQRPPSVRITGAEAVIAMLKICQPDGSSLVRFVRTKEEVNKEAILNEPDAIKGVAGITVITGVEDFAIVPFEQEV